MRVNIKNNPAKFHPNPIWNDGTLGFFKQSPQQEDQEEKEQDEMISDMRSVPDLKNAMVSELT